MAALKDIFYKFCFCLGLGTASVYSYGQVQIWLHGPAVLSQNNSNSDRNVLQEKVETLAQSPSGAGTVSRNFEAERLAAELAAQKHYQQVTITSQPAMAVNVSTDPSVAAVSPSATPASLVSASPSPGASPGAVPGTEATAEASPSPAALDENGNPIVQITSAPGVTYNPEMVNPIPVYDPSLAQQAAAAGGTNTGLSADSSAAKATSNLDPNAAAGYSPLVMTGGGITSNTGSVSAASAAAATNASAAASNVTSTLTPADVNMITASVLNPAFSNLQQPASGELCSGSCNSSSQINLFPNRWAKDEGLETAASLAIKSSSGGSVPVEFDLTFKIQNAQLTEQSVVLSMKPSSVSVTTTTKGAQVYKTFLFSLPSVTAAGQYPLANMQASLVYLVNGTGTGETGSLVNPSTLTFVRTKVTTVAQTWDPTAANRSPAATDPYVIADQILYTLNLQK